MKRILTIAVMLAGLLVGSAFAKDKKEYQVGVLQKHDQNTERVGTDFSTIHCNVDSERCVGSASGIYQESNWWHVRVDGADGYWQLQPNWQDNSKNNPLNTAKEGDKILFRMGRRHYINGAMDVAYLPRTDDPGKEIMLLAKWFPDHPVVAPQAQPKSQLEVACAAHKLSPEQEKQMCNQPPAAPVASIPAVASSVNPTDAQVALTIPAMDCVVLKPQMPIFQSQQDKWPLTLAAMQAHCPPIREMTKEETNSVQATPADLSDPRIARLKVMCEHGMITVPAVRQMSCDLYGFNYPGRTTTK